MESKFNSNRHNKTIINIEDDQLLIVESFKYPVSFLQENGGVDRDILYRILVRRLK